MQRGLMGLLCRWPSITEWEMHITAQCSGPRLRNVSSGTLNSTIPYLSYLCEVARRNFSADLWTFQNF